MLSLKIMLINYVFKCNDVKGSCNSSWSVKESEHVPCGFSYKVVCVDDRFSKDVVVYRANEMSRANTNERGVDCVSKFISCILDEYKYCKKILRDYFNKSLIVSAEEEEMFQNACSFWNCGKLCFIMKKYVIIVTLVVNLEELLILVVMLILKLVKKFLLCFII